jgi:hypothetical protein
MRGQLLDVTIVIGFTELDDEDEAYATSVVLRGDYESELEELIDGLMKLKGFVHLVRC